MSTQIANFASCLGKYDGSTLYGAGTTFDPSSIVIGNSDLSLNSGYLSNPNAFTTPGAGNGNGFSVTGWFNPGSGSQSANTPLVDMVPPASPGHLALCVSGNNTLTAINSFPQCILWLDASDSSTIASSSNLVSQWNDKSGFNNHMTASTTQPTFTASVQNGKPAINFGSGKYMQNSLMALPATSSTTGYTIFAVGYTTITNANTRMLGSVADGTLQVASTNGSYTNYDYLANTPSIAVTSWSILELVMANNYQPYVNGTAQNTKGVAQPAITGVQVGTAGTVTSQC